MAEAAGADCSRRGDRDAKAGGASAGAEVADLASSNPSSKALAPAPKP